MDFNLVYLLNAVFTGIFAVFGMYHLISYFILKQKILLYYSIFILGLTLHWSLYLIAKYSYTNTEIFIERINKVSVLTAMMTTFGLLMYTKDYLNITKDENPRLFRVYSIFIQIVILLPLAHLLNNLILGHKEFNDVLVLFTAITALCSIFLNIFSGLRLDSSQKTNRYYTLSYIPIVLAAFIYIIAWFIKKHHEFDASNLVLTSSILVTLQLILFSVIISLKFKAIENENLRIQVKANEILTTEVEKQTKNLHQAKVTLEYQNKELEKTNQLKNRIFSLLTHDVRGPLNTITELFAIIERDVSDSALKPITKRLKNKIDERITMVNSLLEWSYRQLEGITVTKKSCDIQEVFLSIVSEFEDIAAAKGIGITMDIAWPQLYIDEHMFMVVLRNLTSNALKYSRSGQEVILSSKKMGEHIDIKIQDFGLGMNTDWYAEFKKSGRLKTRKGSQGEQGTGFGLLITKDFVEMNDGELICMSEMDKGTTFILRFADINSQNILG